MSLRCPFKSTRPGLVIPQERRKQLREDPPAVYKETLLKSFTFVAPEKECLGDFAFVAPRALKEDTVSSSTIEASFFHREGPARKWPTREERGRDE